MDRWSLLCTPQWVPVIPWWKAPSSRCGSASPTPALQTGKSGMAWGSLAYLGYAKICRGNKHKVSKKNKQTASSLAAEKWKHEAEATCWYLLKSGKNRNWALLIFYLSAVWFYCRIKVPQTPTSQEHGEEENQGQETVPDSGNAQESSCKADNSRAGKPDDKMGIAQLKNYHPVTGTTSFGVSVILHFPIYY